MDDNEILLVEDQPDDETLTLDALNRCGISARIAVARDGAEALAYLLPKSKEERQDHPAIPRMILLDLKLPKVSGLEVLRRIRADPRTRYVPVVILTSSSESEDVRTSYANGANAYVRKPLDFECFLKTIHCLESFWITVNETV